MATIEHIQGLLRKASDYNTSLLQRKKRDISIYSGNFWTEDRINEYDRKGRVCMTANQYPKYKSAISSPYSKSPYFAEVNEDGKQDLSELQASLTDWQNRTQTKDVFLQAVEQACICGVGYCVLSTNEDEVNLECVKDISCVALDPCCQETDGSDAEYGAVVNYISKAKAKRIYGDDVVDYKGHCQLMDIGDQWNCPVDSVPVVSFFEIRDDGAVEFTKFVGDKIVVDSMNLSPIKRIPIFRVTFVEVKDANKIDYIGIVAETYTLQCALNVALSTLVERLNKSPKATVLISTKQLDGLEEYYKRMHTKESLAIVYNSASDDPIPQLIQEHYNTDDIRETIGMLQNAIATTIGVPMDGIAPASSDPTATQILVQQANSESNVNTLYESAQRCARAVVECVIDCLSFIYGVEPPTFKLINGPTIITDKQKRRQELTMIAQMSESPATKEILLKHIIDTFEADIREPIVADIVANNTDINYLSEDKQTELPPTAIASLERMKQMLDTLQQQYDEAQGDAEQLAMENQELKSQLLQMQQDNLLAIQQSDRDYKLSVAKLQQEQQKIDLQAAKVGADIDSQNVKDTLEASKVDAELNRAAVDLEQAKVEAVKDSLEVVKGM